ncbi:MAG: hypothetical protein RBR15_05075 [Sphaerochaeta sp.]|nr:hypothetical protein [Sphaerochaeta sp.]
MKKLAKAVGIILILAIASTSLFAVATHDQAVIRITAYVPEKTTFSIFDDTFVVASNAYNFTYTVEESIGMKTLFVKAT